MFSGYLSEIRAKPHHPFTPRNVLFSPIILVNGVEESPFVTEILFGCVYAPVFAKNDLWSGTSKSLSVISRYSISKHRPERHLIRRKLRAHAFQSSKSGSAAHSRSNSSCRSIHCE